VEKWREENKVFIEPTETSAANESVRLWTAQSGASILELESVRGGDSRKKNKWEFRDVN